VPGVVSFESDRFPTINVDGKIPVMAGYACRSEYLRKPDII
jgi:hypothetical protein